MKLICGNKQTRSRRKKTKVPFSILGFVSSHKLHKGGVGGERYLGQLGTETVFQISSCVSVWNWNVTYFAMSVSVCGCLSTFTSYKKHMQEEVSKKGGDATFTFCALKLPTCYHTGEY